MAHRDDGFGTDQRSRRRAYAKARREGIDIGGKVYSRQLAAWYGSREEVKAICAAKGWDCEGAGVDYQGPEPQHDPLEGPYRVAPDLVERYVEETIEKQYEGRRDAVDIQELREATQERLAGTQG